MKVFNLNGDEWDRIEERPGWRSKDAWVGARIDAELIGGSMYELEPGVWEDIDAAQNYSERLPTEGPESMIDKIDNPVFRKTS